MKNKIRILSATVAASVCAGLSAQTKPNIVVVFVDDMGYGDLGCFGAIGYNTPTLDSLAATGIKFTQFYAAQAVSSASRAGMMTGCYPNRIGIEGALFPFSKNGIHQDEKTIAEMLKEQGYATGMVGKWHLGCQQQFLPLQNGFEEYFGLPYSNDMWPYGYDGVKADTASRRGHYPPLRLISGNEPTDEINTLELQATLTTRYTEKAVDYINRHQKNPFFLYFAHSMPHTPIAVSSKFKGKSKQGLYGDVLMEIDWSVKQVVEALKKNGLINNTLIIFTSDNGPWLNFGDCAGSAGGLREGKGTSFEGGQRVPCIMNWPAAIPQGKTCNLLSSTIDIFPTLAEITGGKLPDHSIDGISILSLLKGDFSFSPRKELWYYYNHNDLEAVRNEQFKLVFPHTHRTYTKCIPGKGNMPGIESSIKDTVGLALFDLRRDPGERYNLIKEYPEVVQELMKIADKAREELGDDLTGKKGKGVRVSGKIK